MEKDLDRFRELIEARLRRDHAGVTAALPNAVPGKAAVIPARSAHGIALGELDRLKEDPRADVELAAVSQEHYEQNRMKVSRRADLELQEQRAAGLDPAVVDGAPEIIGLPADYDLAKATREERRQHIEAQIRALEEKLGILGEDQ